MAKWYSALFSDIRNKLADQVVFGSWKGRGYFRQWVIPTNPKTNPQIAVRAVMAEIVSLFQTYVVTDPEKGEWNQEALPQLISGFNLFVQEGKKSEIAADTGTLTKEIDITYTLGFSSAYAAVYRTDDEDANLTDVTPVGGLSMTPDSEFTDTTPIAATIYKYYIADTRPLVSPDAAPQDYQMCTHWTADKVNGLAVAARIVSQT